MPRDKLLADDVEAELKWDPQVDAGHIGVSVRDGAVTLSGFASSHSEKLAAVRAAERVYGVQAVADDIQVRVPSANVRDDAEIGHAIQQSLTFHVDVPSTVQAEIRNGAVTLNGEVDWMYQRSEADRLVRHTKGVSHVIDLIKVRPRASSSDIQQRVNHALRRRADLANRPVWVTTENHTVQLHGHVHSFHEKRAAEDAAYAAPGVATVDNRITIRP